MSLYSGLYKILAKPLRAMFRLEVEGADNMIHGKGCLLCANHTGLLDVIVIAVGTDRPVRFMAKKELFKIPLLKQLITALGAYPVDRGGADVGAIKKTIKMLGEGVSIGMFPQGHRQKGKDPRETEVKSGVAMVAVRAKATVLPCFIQTKKRKWSAFCRVDVYVGKPIKFEELGYNSEAVGEYARISNYIFDKICSIGENADA